MTTLRRLHGLRVLALASAIGLAATGVPSPVAAAAPSNDDFASAARIGALPYSDSRVINDATTETNEPTTDCYFDGQQASIWFRLKRTQSEYLRADTIGSDHDTEIGVFRGNSLATLTTVACNLATYEDDSVQSSVTWKAAKDVRYYIQVSIPQGVDADGTSKLHVQVVTPPGNDLFKNAKTIGSLPYSTTESTRNATFASPEPGTVCDVVSGATVWFRYTPTSTQYVQVNTLATGFDTYIEVFRGTSASALTQVDCNDDTSGGYDTYESLVTFRAAKNVTYYLRVGGWGGASGTLNLSVRSVTPPSNDNFSHARPYPGEGPNTDSTRRATIQGGEPQPSCLGGVPIGATIWYAITAAEGESIVLDLDDSVDPDGLNVQMNAVGAIWSGSSLGTLTEEVCVLGGAQGLTDVLSAGTYWLQLGGQGSNSGQLWHSASTH